MVCFLKLHEWHLDRQLNLMPHQFQKLKYRVNWKDLSICCQYCCSSIVVWDIRPPKSQKPPADEKKNLTGIPTTFKHLDLTWKPHLKVMKDLLSVSPWYLVVCSQRHYTPCKCEQNFAFEDIKL
jgi:hypothetical protein